MIEHHFKIALDIALAGLACVTAITLEQWATIWTIIGGMAPTAWFAYRFIDEWLQKRKV